MMKKIKINPDNLNLRRACYYYPCHQNIPESEYDCRMCYCEFYEECSNLELTELGGYWLHYRDQNNVPRKVWACENCTILHYRRVYEKVQKWRIKGYPDRKILLILARYMKGRVR
jgi:Zn-finger protein